MLRSILQIRCKPKSFNSSDSVRFKLYEICPILSDIFENGMYVYCRMYLPTESTFTNLYNNRHDYSVESGNTETADLQHKIHAIGY